MSTAGQEVDIVVLGGGSGGYSTALRASQLGLTVALIEEDNSGGRAYIQDAFRPKPCCT